MKGKRQTNNLGQWLQTKGKRISLEHTINVERKIDCELKSLHPNMLLFTCINYRKTPSYLCILPSKSSEILCRAYFSNFYSVTGWWARRGLFLVGIPLSAFLAPQKSIPWTIITRLLCSALLNWTVTWGKCPLSNARHCGWYISPKVLPWMIYVNLLFSSLFMKLLPKWKAVAEGLLCLEMAFASLISFTHPKPTKNRHEICDLFLFCFVWLCNAAKREILFLCTCINTHLYSLAFSI